MNPSNPASTPELRGADDRTSDSAVRSLEMPSQACDTCPRMCQSSDQTSLQAPASSGRTSATSDEASQPEENGKSRANSDASSQPAENIIEGRGSFRRTAAVNNIITPVLTGHSFSQRLTVRRSASSQNELERDASALQIAVLVVLTLNASSAFTNLRVLLVFWSQGAWIYVSLAFCGFPLWLIATWQFARLTLSPRTLRHFGKDVCCRCKCPVRDLRLVYRAYNKLYELWTQTGLLILSSVPALVVCLLAMCLDAKYDTNSTATARERMALSIMTSCVCCSWNLQMHDMGWVMWTGPCTVTLQHVFLRVAEVTMRFLSFGLFSASICAVAFATSNKRYVGPCVMCFLLCLEWCCWFFCVKATRK